MPKARDLPNHTSKPGMTKGERMITADAARELGFAIGNTIEQCTDLWRK